MTTKDEQPLQDGPEVKEASIEAAIVRMSNENPAQFNEACLKALKYADKKVSKFNNSGFVTHIDAEDLAQTAILKTWSGKRPWDQQKTPDLFVHLAGCIKSEISNIYQSSDNKMTDRRSSADDALRRFVSRDNPEELAELANKIEFLIDYVAEEKEHLVNIVKMIEKEGIDKPKELSQALGLSVKEVNTHKVALRRLFTRSNFLIRYIARNRKELLQVAKAILEEKIEDENILSKKLGLDVERTKILKSEVVNLVEDLRIGEI